MELRSKPRLGRMLSSNSVILFVFSLFLLVKIGISRLDSLPCIAYPASYCALIFAFFVSLLLLKDTFIQKTKKLYQDTRTQRNISKLNDELYEVHQIMTRNVQEVLGVGEKLDRKFPSQNSLRYPLMLAFGFESLNFELMHCILACNHSFAS